MEYFEHYQAEQIDEFNYCFFSVGVRGKFNIIVRFTKMGENIYNLGFGVVDEEFDWLDDRVELRNGDSQIILATVANVVLSFLDEHPTASVFATGSTTSRTRLYQMGISRILPVITGYEIAGYVAERNEHGNLPHPFTIWKGEWCAFRSGISFDAFLIYKQ
jgi:hypothetical protein